MRVAEIPVQDVSVDRVCPDCSPGELGALHLTLVKGYDPDRPEGLQKITRER